MADRQRFHVGRRRHYRPSVIDRQSSTTDKASASIRERPGLDACFYELHRGDVLLVQRLDRLGRSVRRLVTLIDQFQEMGVVGCFAKLISADQRTHEHLGPLVAAAESEGFLTRDAHLLD
jgi:hypothetical protein